MNRSTPHPLLVPVLGSLLALATTSAGQQLGSIDLQVANPEVYGSTTLQARLHYPARTPAPNAPIDLSAGPRPVVVFLAGHSFRGRDYAALGEALARRGYLAVMNETGSFDGFLLGEDGRAWFRALAQESQRSTSFLYGAVDPKRIAIIGHSMGGANVYRVLAEQPGFLAGVAIAPLIVPPEYPPRVVRPFAIVAGAGDTTTPWASHAKPCWDALTSYRGTKVFYLLDTTANHLNLAFSGFAGQTPADLAAFTRSSDVALSFLDHYLQGTSNAFDHCVGAEARGDPHLQRLWTEVRDPVLFEAGRLQLGQHHELVCSGEPGISVQLIAADTSQIATPLGDYLLDPITTIVLWVVQTGPDGLCRFAWTVPQDPGFVGLKLHVQGLTQVVGGGFAFTNALSLVVQP